MFKLLQLGFGCGFLKAGTMAEAELLAAVRAHIQADREGFLACLMAELGEPYPAVSPTQSDPLPGGQRATCRYCPPGLAPLFQPPHGATVVRRGLVLDPELAVG